MIKNLLTNLYMKICRLLFGVNKNTILFQSFHGKTYSDNPRALSNAIHKLRPDIKIIWAFNDPEQKKGIVPEYIKTIKIGKFFSYYKNLACCKVFVSNFNLPIVSKGRKQVFVQVWHGDKPIKRVLYESKFVPADFKIAEEIAGYCDYAVAGSVAGEKQFINAFKYKGEILSYGTPRNDVLLNYDHDIVKEIKAKIDVLDDEKIVLFAPTLRRKYSGKNDKQETNNVNLSSLLDNLGKISGAKWKCLLRAHPAMSGIFNDNSDERVVDVTEYEDMADLLLISDMLITDYSSSAGDFALLNRPVILYQEDLNEYLSKDRNLCFDMKETPFFRASSQTELEKLISSLDKEKVIKNCQQIKEFFGDYETGESSKKIIETIFDRRRK